MSLFILLPNDIQNIIHRYVHKYWNDSVIAQYELMWLNTEYKRQFCNVLIEFRQIFGICERPENNYFFWIENKQYYYGVRNQAANYRNLQTDLTDHNNNIYEFGAVHAIPNIKLPQTYRYSGIAIEKHDQSKTIHLLISYIVLFWRLIKGIFAHLADRLLK